MVFWLFCPLTATQRTWPNLTDQAPLVNKQIPRAVERLPAMAVGQ